MNEGNDSPRAQVRAWSILHAKRLAGLTACVEHLAELIRLCNPDRAAKRLDAEIERLLAETEVEADADWHALHGRRRAA